MAFVNPDSILEYAYADVKRVVSSENAPAAIGPYSQAIQAGESLYVSGQIPVDPKPGKVAQDIASQAKQSLENVKAILSSAGYRLSDVVKTTVFVTDINNFSAVNEVYATYFEKEAPARSFVAVKDLPKGVGIEIEAVAWHRK